jgi:chaperone modulatory protein CbpM
MIEKTPSEVSGIIETSTLCTLDELCLACDVEAGWVVELVEHGVIEPAQQAGSSWQFASLSIDRVAKAKRLGRDLDLNPTGLALVLDLLDEIEILRSRMREMEVPGGQPPDG